MANFGAVDLLALNEQRAGSYTKSSIQWKSEYLPYAIGAIGLIASVAIFRIYRKRKPRLLRRGS